MVTTATNIGLLLDAPTARTMFVLLIHAAYFLTLDYSISSRCDRSSAEEGAGASAAISRPVFVDLEYGKRERASIGCLASACPFVPCRLLSTCAASQVYFWQVMHPSRACMR